MKKSSSNLSPPPSPHSAPLALSAPSSPLRCCPELNLSCTVSPSKPTKSQPLETGQQHEQQSGLKPISAGRMGRKGNTKQVCFEKPVVVTVRQEPCVTLSRDTQRLSMEPPLKASNQDLGCLDTVRPNTTVTMKAELRSLQESEFNIQKALQETLQKSERTKNLINCRATEEVSVPRHQLVFDSLVSIDMQEDQLITQVLQDRLLLAPASRCSGNKTTDGPSLDLFMTSDLLRQKPIPKEEEPANTQPCPSTRLTRSPFDLHRLQRHSEATP